MWHLHPAGRCSFAGAWSLESILPTVWADRAAVWQMQQQGPCGDAVLVLWLAHRFGLQWDMQAPGHEQRWWGVSKDTLAAGETCLLVPDWKISQSVALLVPHWHFSGKDCCACCREGVGEPLLCPGLEVCCRPQRREVCSSSTAGKVLKFCVCPVWQTLAIPAGLPRNSLSVPKNPLVVWEGR